jgi:Leucine-rich repeat (LRR) protein
MGDMYIYVKYAGEENNLEHGFRSFEKINNYDNVVSMGSFDYFIKSIPKLPINIRKLDFPVNELTELPELPNSLEYINFEQNQLIKLPKLPNNLKKLNCRFNKLTLLPKLPNSLQTLYCDWNKLSSLPELPTGLIEFSCVDIVFIKKPKMKYLIKIIYM